MALAAHDRGYQHWVLFNGWDGDDPRVFDPADPDRRWSVGELLSAWDGAAVLVGRDPPQRASLVAHAVLWSAAAAMLAALGLLALRRLPRVALARLAGLLAVAAAASAAWEVATGQRLLRPDELHGLVAAEYAPPPVPEAAVADVEAAVADVEAAAHGGGALLVDARLPDDHAQGAIPGSASLPINLRPSQWPARIAGWDRQRPVIVYCQSAGCAWAKHIAQQLLARGFVDVRRFPGGYVEWERARHGRP
jgi:rhodanese-related sulfurtransferase